MAEFRLQVPVVQADPLVNVEVRHGSPMPPGKYRFRLVVVDDADNESEPAFLDVIIRDAERPTAVLDMVNADKAIIDPVVGLGASFLLSGARSSDVPPGRVKSYRFTLIDAPAT